MKNIRYKLVLSAFSALMLAGCNDIDDVQPSGSTITTKQKEEVVATDPSKVEASVSAIAASINQFGKTIDDNTHCDFGYPALMLFTDTRSADLVSYDIGYNWFGDALTFNDMSYTQRPTRMFWKTMYNQIFACNSVVKSIEYDTTDDVLMYYLAQALSVRAFDYFFLAQMYQHTFIGHEDALCVPLITDKNADEAASNGCARSTVREVYAQIESDINKAVELLEATTKTRPDNRYVSKEVAYGIRARVNLVLNKWAEAAADAQKAIDGSDAPLSIAEASAPGFNEIEDFMWGVLVAETDRVVTTGICNFPSHMGSLNYGYASVGAWRMISKKLFNQINSTDARKGWWLDANGKSANLNADQTKQASKYACPAYTQMKYAPYQGVMAQATGASDIPMMRVEEMYLILAEAQAMAGNPAEGAATLENFIKTYRDPAYTCAAGSATDVQNAVWLQRRIELWGEGFAYFDIMRLKKGLDRRGAGFEAPYVFLIPDGDPTLIYRIPEAEEQANSLISAADNNPVAPTPLPVTDEE